MNGRLGQHPRPPQQLNSQVGFYLLPPDQEVTKSRRSNKKKSLYKKGSRRWSSQSQLDAIAEASDESRPPSPDNNDRLPPRGPAWNSSPARLIRDNTATSRGLLGDVPLPGVNLMTTSQSRTMNACRHPQSRICENLKFGLQNLRFRGQRDVYKALVDAVIVGPEVVRSSEAEDILGIGADLVYKARSKLRGGPDFEGEETNTSLEFDPYDEKRRHARYYHGGGGRVTQQRLILGMRDLFLLYARVGDPHNSGQHITLNQSDKWLKQAGIIDSWNVTITDTAISYRKISRGSKYLDYEAWKVFLEELAYRKRIGIDVIHDKLLAAGKPAPNQISVKTGSKIFRVYEPSPPPSDEHDK